MLSIIIHQCHNILIFLFVPNVVWTEFPLLNDILKKYGAEGEEELGQAQFAELLQPILQETADALSENHVVIIHNVKVVNGSKLRKVDHELDLFLVIFVVIRRLKSIYFFVIFHVITT